MAQFTDPFKSFWQARAPRERTVLGSAAVVIAALIVVTVFYAPAQARRHRLIAQMPVLQDTLLRMQSQAAQARTLAGQGAAVPSAPGVQREQLAALLSEEGLAITQIGSAAQGFSITLNKVRFASLVGLTDRARTRLHLVVQEAHATPIGEGMVDASLILAPAQGGR